MASYKGNAPLVGKPWEKAWAKPRGGEKCLALHSND